MRRCIVVPSPRLLRTTIALAVGAAVVPFAPFAGSIVAATVLVVVLLATASVAFRPRRDDLVVERVVPSAAHVGRYCEYRVRVTNNGDVARTVELRDVLPPSFDGNGCSGTAIVEPGAVTEWTAEFVPLARGEHVLSPIGIRVALPLHLLELQYETPTTDRLVVLPGRPSAETAWLLRRAAVLPEAGARAVARLGGEWEFESMREYVVGDDPRRIDWKTTARHGRPWVRQYQIERQSELVLAIDCGRLMGTHVDGITKLDLAMTPLLDVAAVALEHGERVGLLAFDSAPRAYLPPRGGLAQLHLLTDALARLPAPVEPTSYLRAIARLEAAHRRRCLVIVFTDFTDEISAADIHRSLGALAARYEIIFVGVADPHVERVFVEPTTDVRALFEKAIAGQLLGERRRVLRGLERLGVFTLDAEPRRLSAPLLRRFLDLRRNGTA